MLSLNAKLLTGVLLSASLVACGGGGDSTTVIPTPDPTPTPSISESTQTLTAALWRSDLVAESIRLSFLERITSLSGTVVASYNAVTFPLLGVQAQSVESTDGFANNIVYKGLATSGDYRAGGNLLKLCVGAGGQEANIVIGGMIPLTAATLSELNGRTFRARDCTTTVQTPTTINTDGSVKLPDGSILSAADVAKYFSDAGYTDADGDVSRAKAYKHRKSNGQFDYFLLLLDKSAKGVGSVAYAEQI